MARDLAMQYNYIPGTLGGALGALGGGGGGGNMWGGGGNLYQQADYQMGDNQDLQEISVVSRSGFGKSKIKLKLFKKIIKIVGVSLIFPKLFKRFLALQFFKSDLNNFSANFSANFLYLSPEKILPNIVLFEIL